MEYSLDLVLLEWLINAMHHLAHVTVHELGDHAHVGATFEVGDVLHNIGVIDVVHDPLFEVRLLDLIQVHIVLIKYFYCNRALRPLVEGLLYLSLHPFSQHSFLQ